MELISEIVKAAGEMEGFRLAKLALEQGQREVEVGGVFGTARSLLFAFLHRECQRSTLMVAEGPEEAEALRDDLEALLGPDTVRYLPPTDERPRTRVLEDYETLGSRLEALSDLLGGKTLAIVTTARSLLEAVPPPDALRSQKLTLAQGDSMPLERLVEGLDRFGFERTGTVEEPWTFAVRGGIVDVFSLPNRRPVRIEFFGNEIESIREFDIGSQRSTAYKKGVEILPASPEPPVTGQITRPVRSVGATIVDYLPEDSVLLVDRSDYIESEVVKIWEESQASGGGEVKPLAEPKAVLERLCRFQTVRTSPQREPAQGAFVVQCAAQEPFHGSLHMLLERLRQLNSRGYRSFVLCQSPRQAERLSELFHDVGVAVGFSERTLHSGFMLHDAGLAVFVEHEIFGRRRYRYRHPEFKGGTALSDYSALGVGDYVVHVDHGVGRFAGIERLSVDGETRDCLTLLYRDGDTLYVPVERMDSVQKYVSQEGQVPSLERLGGSSWQRAKSRTKRAIKDMARELLALYAERKVREGIAFSPDSVWQTELEDAFPYEDTPDQAAAAADVKEDMESVSPMDRLICGDVGYGKTEVAVRAAFKAVMDSRQVALVAPTTILAQQHTNTLTERLAGYPVNIAMLSRFLSRAERTVVLKGLREGRIDIVIGTHRLLQKDVIFKKLGFVIIDEEHRFGVAQKERLKQATKLVDVLTLTATPIPRTLHMSLMGARDMSVINTPPKDRQPIHTEICAFDEDVMAKAIYREISRGGQVYFVHNRVQSIEAMAAFLRRLVPGVSIAVAHGQMKEERLEQVMIDFLNRRYDCLLSTMIIESGLDFPNVNTLIVNRADKLGLAQLYQLRGRVGRSARKAYAYLLVPAHGVLTQTAKKRLRALEEFTELGSGLKLALRDMEIRGVGNILGTEQHGFIAAVGFDLYCRLLDEAVRELKGEPAEARVEPELDIRVDAYLPDSYVGDEQVRVSFYRRLALAREPTEIDLLKEELVDRFGRAPQPVDSLLDLISVRVLAGKIGFKSVRLKGGIVTAAFPPERQLTREDIRRLVEKSPVPLEFRAAGQLEVQAALDGGGPGDKLVAVKKLLQELA